MRSYWLRHASALTLSHWETLNPPHMNISSQAALSGCACGAFYRQWTVRCPETIACAHNSAERKHSPVLQLCSKGWNHMVPFIWYHSYGTIHASIYVRYWVCVADLLSNVLEYLLGRTAFYDSMYEAYTQTYMLSYMHMLYWPRLCISIYVHIWHVCLDMNGNIYNIL